VPEGFEHLIVLHCEGEVRELARVPVDVDRDLLPGLRPVVDELHAVIGVFALHQGDRVLHEPQLLFWVTYLRRPERHLRTDPSGSNEPGGPGPHVDSTP
jgi:hypothetical protein